MYDMYCTRKVQTQSVSFDDTPNENGPAHCVQREYDYDEFFTGHRIQLFELENDVQGARRAHDITDDRDPDAHGEIVETLDGRYLSHD